MPHARSYFSDEYFYEFELKGDVSHIDGAGRDKLETLLQRELNDRDVVESSVDFDGDKLKIHATTTVTVWGVVTWYLDKWDVEWHDWEREYEIDDFEDCEPSWYDE